MSNRMRQTLANIGSLGKSPSSTSEPEAEFTSFTIDRDTHSSSFAYEHVSEATSSTTERVPHSRSSTLAREQVGTPSLSEREAERDTQGSTRHRKASQGSTRHERHRKAEEGKQGCRRLALDCYTNHLPLQSTKKSRVGAIPRYGDSRRRPEHG